MRTPDPTLRVRPATDADVPALAAVKSAAARRGYGPFTTPTQLDGWLAGRATPGFVTGRLTLPDSLFLVAERGETLLGGGLIRREGDGGYLADVYCDPPGTGAGTAIVTALLAHADTQAWGAVRCFCLAPNAAAVEFFTQFGFTTAGRTPNQELPGDLIEMTRPRS